MRKFGKIDGKIDSLCGKLWKTDWEKEAKEKKLETLQEYVDCLVSFQKYYEIAVPLTSYCEQKMREKEERLLEYYAVPFKKLDVEKMAVSLERIRKLKEAGKTREFREAAKKHLERFAWIKTAYNIIQEYTMQDLESELKQESKKAKEKKKPEVTMELKPFVSGLQVGIFLRNRMKEKSQEVWYRFEKLGKSMASDLGIARDNFFQLRYKEVFESYKKGKCVVPKKEIGKRNRGFVSGILENKEVLITGKDCEELFSFFNSAQSEKDEISGTIACKGKAIGKARIILNPSQFSEFEKGNILVTAMTTPNFVVLMKKAAAIVTDEGGLSSHAAIVSREMGIPCIIGTKISTKVFKDGDIVEVDAEKGVVRKAK